MWNPHVDVESTCGYVAVNHLHELKQTELKENSINHFSFDNLSSFKMTDLKYLQV